MGNEITEITTKIEALDAIRVKLEQDLLKLQEEELELNDEREHLLSLSIQPVSHSASQWKEFGNVWSLRVLRINSKRSRLNIHIQALDEGEDPRSCPLNITSYLLASRSW